MGLIIVLFWFVFYFGCGNFMLGNDLRVFLNGLILWWF